MHEDESESNVKGDEAAATRVRRNLHFISRKSISQLSRGPRVQLNRGANNFRRRRIFTSSLSLSLFRAGRQAVRVCELSIANNRASCSNFSFQRVNLTLDKHANNISQHVHLSVRFMCVKCDIKSSLHVHVNCCRFNA